MKFGISLLIAVAIIFSCSSDESGINIKYDQLPYSQLSDYNFFIGSEVRLEPNEGVIPYDVITPLFTDYAYKKRFAYIPEGMQATISGDGILDFPNKSVLIKNFYYPLDFNDELGQIDMIETRLLVKINDKWNAYTYLWNENESDAKLLNVGGYVDVAWKDEEGENQQIQYAIPNKNQCKGCHNVSEELLPIGPKFRNLNHDFEYSDGKMNQLDYWKTKGILSDNPQMSNYTLANWENAEEGLHDRAIAYLEVNCGHCHDELGQASTTGLFLNSEYENLVQIGICKTPVAAGIGSGGYDVSVLPGDAESSILHYRMASNDPGVMMPELGRTVAHKEGLALIADWINNLEGNCNSKTL